MVVSLATPVASGTGDWLTLPYEEFAECFAAVNTGDKERTENYEVPLDVVKMRSFFASLVK